MKTLIHCVALLLLFNYSNAQDKNISGDYEGYIKLPGTNLKVIVHLKEDDRNLSGTIDIPEQNAKGLLLTNVKFNKSQIDFGISDVPGDPYFSGLWKNEVDSLTGKFTQNGMSFPMLMRKKSAELIQQTKLSLASKLLRIEAYTDSLLKKSKTVGLSFGIIKDGEIIMNNGFGYSDYENKIKCNNQTLFAIGSCTKAFTTALLAILHDEAKFDWEKPVKNYIPYFTMKDEFANKEINAIDLCSHRSGLPRHDMVWYGSSLKRHELIEKIAVMDPNKPFRTTWQYNNFMLVAAGVIAEEIENDTWENLISKRIFEPLGMTGSRIHFNDFTSEKNKSIGYKVTDKKIVSTPYRNIDEMGPAGSVFSNSTDMLKWVNMFLNKGKYGDKSLISNEQIKHLISPQMLMPGNDPDIKATSYALGWMNFIYKGKSIVAHGGNIDGFSAYVLMMPDDNTGIVILSNKDGSGVPELLSLYAIDCLFDYNEYDWYEEKVGKLMKQKEVLEAEAIKKDTEKKSKKESSAKKPTKPGPMHNLPSYAGEYENEAYGAFKIDFNNAKLISHYHGFDLETEHKSFETFTAKFEGEDIKMTFFTNENGKIEWLQMQIEPLVAPIKFYKKVPDYLNNTAYLQKIFGKYDVSGLMLTVEMDKSVLMANLSDGQSYAILPSGDDMFKLKGLDGFGIEFIFDAKGICTGCILHQPNGDFEAKKLK